MNSFDLTRIKKTVCVFAHPDDESFGPSGTIAKLSKNSEVYVICVTDGGTGPNNRTQKGLAKKRKLELTNASKVLGVNKLYFLGYRDGELKNNIYHKVAKDIKLITDEIHPDTLLTFELRGCSGHIDHVFVSMVTSYIYRESKYIKNILYYCDPESINKFVGKYFIYHPPGLSKNKVDEIIDVSDVQTLKEKAILCHKSQKSDGIWILAFLKINPKKEYFFIKSR